MKLIAIFLAVLISTTAVAGLPPTSLKGQSGSKSTTFNFEVPHNQATKTSSGGLIETGNKNRLENPGFEHSAFLTGWTLGTLTGTATQTIGADTATPLEEGSKKSLTFQCAGGASGGTCTIYQDVTTSYVIQGRVSALIDTDVAWNGTSGARLHHRVDGATSSSLYVDISNLDPIQYNIPSLTGTTSTGIALVITAAASQTINVEIDDAYVGTDTGIADVPQVKTQTLVSTLSAAMVATTVRGDGSGLFTTSTVGGKFRITAVEKINIQGNGSVDVTSSATAVGAQATWTLNGSSIQNTVSSLESSAVTANSGAATSISVSLNPSEYIEFLGNTYGGGSIASASVSLAATRSTNSSVYSSNNADTDWAACNFSTLAWQGLGTVTNQLLCKRQGSDLLMQGKFIAGTVTSSIAQIPLPLWNGSTLTLKNFTSSTNNILGKGSNNHAATANYKDISILGASGLSYLTMGYVYDQNALNPLTSVGGNTNAATTGLEISFDARIPIEGWENSNIIIGSFKDTPKTIGSSGSDIQSVYFGAGAGCASNCTTGTCTICRQVGSKITSVTWSAAGQYRVNGIDGTKYVCSGGGTGPSYGEIVHFSSSSASNYAQVCKVTGAGGGCEDSNQNTVVCIGIP